MTNISLANRIASSWVWPVAAGVGGYLAGQELVRRDVDPRLPMLAGLVGGGSLVMCVVPMAAGMQLTPKLRWFVKADEAVTRGIRPGAIQLSTWLMLSGAAALIGAMAGALAASPRPDS